MAQTLPAMSARAAASLTLPLSRSQRSAASRRRSGATAGRRWNRAWSSRPRSAAARVAALGGGSATASSPKAEGASGHGGRCSCGAGSRVQAGSAATGSAAASASPRAATGSPPANTRSPGPSATSSASIARAATACQLSGGGTPLARTPSAPAITSRSSARVAAT